MYIIIARNKRCEGKAKPEGCMRKDQAIKEKGYNIT